MTLSALRWTVILRDGGCVASRLDKLHSCRDRWGQPHLPTDLDSLTLEHVTEHAGGKRRDEERWTLALCHHANVIEHWSAANRAIALAYLAGVRAGLEHGRRAA